MNKEEAQVAMLAAIPATGEISFEDFRASVTAAGNAQALHHFKKAHKSGAFAVRVRAGVLLVRLSTTPNPDAPIASPAPSVPTAPVNPAR